MSDLGPTTPTEAAGSSSRLNIRKERGAIAAQACETCRSRKQRCDEQRPKCGTCQKFKLECRYREPQPTKKDKTLVEILDRLKSLEGKIDTLSIQGAINPSSAYSIVPTGVDPGPIKSRMSRQDSIPTSLHLLDSLSPAPLASPPYRYVSATHKLLSWPVFQRTLESIGDRAPLLSPQAIERDGPSIFLGIRATQIPTFADPSGQHSVSVPPKLPGLGASLSMGLSTPNINLETMERLCKHYFDTFNFLYPILDRHVFLSQTFPTVVGESFSENISSTLAYLVFALGEVAMTGSHSDAAMGVYKGRPSGVRGGTMDQPPGLAFFNEARRRMGFNLTDCSVENVQVFGLAALYYQTCFHYAEFWRMSVSASLACQALLSCNPSELSSPSGDLVKRVFWHCSIQETLLNMELDIPLNGLEKFEEMVGMPSFNTGQFCDEDYIGNQTSHYQEHFLSHIYVRKLAVEFHEILHSAFGGPVSVQFPAATQTDHPSLPSTIKKLASQLDQWKALLPDGLRWSDDIGTDGGNEDNNMNDGNLTTAPVSSAVYNADVGDIYPPLAQPALIFTCDLDAPSQNSYPFAIDIQTALLRTRFYWARYLIYRPFVYKVLHHPEQTTREDVAGAIECLRSTIKWPVAMIPVSRNKRVIPGLFALSQNFLGILVLLYISQQHNLLGQIRTSMLGEQFNVEVNETVTLYLDWLRDLRHLDPAARWCWGIARALYRVDD